MMRRLRLVRLAVVVFALWGCSGGKKGETSADTGDVSVQWNGEANLEYSLLPNTVVIDPDSEDGLAGIYKDGETIVLEYGSDLAAKLAPGAVVLIGVSESTPGGGLRKVDTRTDTPANIVVQTSPAKLEDAFSELHLQLDTDLPADSLDRYETSLNGLEIGHFPLGAGGRAGGWLTVDFDDTVLLDYDGNKATKDDQVVASGSLSLFLGVKLDAELSWFTWERIEIGASLEQEGTLSLSTNLPSLDFDEEVSVATMYFAPITAGPIVILPKLELILGANGELSAQVQTSISVDVEASAGSVYENGNWTPYSNQKAEWNFEPPALTASARLKGYAGPRVTLEILGVAGPYAQIDGYLELTADVAENPWWRLAAGLEAFVGIKGEIFGFELVNYQSGALINFEKTIAEADGPFVSCSCDGKECGDDGCGGTCGSCEMGWSCQAGTCVPSSPDCPTDQDCSGLECGPDPVCGESCGQCEDDWVCEAGKCTQTGPTCPADKDCSGHDCGPDPVCGESCGTCPVGSECDDGLCVCVPNCTGKECGDDGCGDSHGCGTCSDGWVCNTGECTDTCTDSCASKGWQCGDEVCGEPCGDCPPGEYCTPSHKCVCEPDCAGKQCGTDGCGGSCGSCDFGFKCDEDSQCALACNEMCSGIECGAYNGCDCGSCTGCASECSDHQCLPVSHANYECNNGDIYWMDSCGDLDGKKEECGAAGCDSGDTECCLSNCAGKCPGAVDGCGGTCSGNDCDGCCSGTICKPGDTWEYCGDNGEACDNCGSPWINPLGCALGNCGAYCGDGECNFLETECSCSEDCGACDGCCDDDECLPGISASACGDSGDSCVSCSSSQYCSQASKTCQSCSALQCDGSFEPGSVTVQEEGNDLVFTVWVSNDGPCKKDFEVECYCGGPAFAQIKKTLFPMTSIYFECSTAGTSASADSCGSYTMHLRCFEDQTDLIDYLAGSYP